MTDRKSSRITAKCNVGTGSESKHRSRKAISYAGLDDGSDDDFASSPSSKKQKSMKQEDKIKKEKKNENKTPRSSSSILKRESQFDNELQRALELSVLETSASQDTSDRGMSDSNPERSPQRTNVKRVKVDIEPIPSAPRLDRVEEIPNSLHLTSESDDLPTDPPQLKPMTPVCGTIIEDTIERVESESEGRKSRREAAKRRPAPKRRFVDDDSQSEGESDFSPNEESASDDDDNDDGEDDFSPSDNDSDFDDGKKKKKPNAKNVKKGSEAVKKKPVPKNQKPAPTLSKPLKSLTAEYTDSKSLCTDYKNSIVSSKTRSLQMESPSTPTVVTTKLSSSTSTPSSSAQSPQTSGNLKSCKSSQLTNRSNTPVSHSIVSRPWKPPGQAAINSSNSVSSVKSPTSGLRLGLSRNQRVKPLHASVQV